jgi:hypothetical protein
MDGGTSIMAELTRGQILKNPEVIGVSTLGVGNTAAKIRLLDGDQSSHIDIKVPDTVGTSYTFTLPADDGTADYYLKTDGSGTTSWAAVSASPGGSTNQIQYNSSGSFAGAAVTTDGTNLHLTSASEVRFNNSGNTAHVAIGASAVSDNRKYSLPDTIGTVGQVLKIQTRANDNNATLHWADDSLGSSGNPGGSDTQVQFNDAGNFGGDAGLTYNKTTDVLSVTGGVDVATGGDYKINSTSVLTSTTLGSGVVNSSLTSVGTLGILAVDNITINGNEVSSTNTNGNIDLNPNGTGFVRILDDAPLRFMDADNTNYAAITAPASVTSDYTLTLPSVNGSINEIIQYDASGIGTFVSNTRTLNFVIDGGGSAIVTGVKGFSILDADYNVTAWTIIGDLSGVASVAVGRTSEPTYPVTTARTYTTVLVPNLGATEIADRVTGITTVQITAGDILQFNVISNTAAHTKLTVALRLVPR